MKTFLSPALFAAALVAASPAAAASFVAAPTSGGLSSDPIVFSPTLTSTFVVDARTNSYQGGTALSTISLVAGQTFSISSSIDDLWLGGPGARWSDANGLIVNRYKTAADDAAGAVGSLIGRTYSPLTRDGFTAPYGSLVGQIGSTYMLLGANGTFTAPTSGVLNLFYWDNSMGNNSGSIEFGITAAGVVPEPATWGMLILGFGAIGAGLRRRAAKVRYA